jgi:hypothetical protein
MESFFLTQPKREATWLENFGDQADFWGIKGLGYISRKVISL